MPVAQIVAGFGKVFVGEIVEKGVSSDCSSCKQSLIHPFYQRAPCKSDAAKQAHSLPTICAKHTACTRRKRVVSAPRVHCALSGSSPAKSARSVHEWLRVRISPPSRRVCFHLLNAPCRLNLISGSFHVPSREPNQWR